jgi:hypothetical protein
MGGSRSRRGRHGLRRLWASRGCEWVVLRWKGASSLAEWRVLRSQEGFATSPDDGQPGSQQVLLYEGPGTDVQDQGVLKDVDYYYTLFGRELAGTWLDLAEVRVTPRCEIFYTRDTPAEGERLSLSGMGPHLT